MRHWMATSATGSSSQPSWSPSYCTSPWMSSTRHANYSRCPEWPFSSSSSTSSLSIPTEWVPTEIQPIMTTMMMEVVVLRFDGGLSCGASDYSSSWQLLSCAGGVATKGYVGFRNRSPFSLNMATKEQLLSSETLSCSSTHSSSWSVHDSNFSRIDWW